jgi:hypothetical protein
MAQVRAESGASPYQPLPRSTAYAVPFPGKTRLDSGTKIMLLTTEIQGIEASFPGEI